MVSWLTNKRITVTGGTGFLGRHVVRKLKEIGCRQVFVFSSKDYDLVDREAVKRLYQDSKPEIVIHLAVARGGIEMSIKSPGRYFYDDIIMDTHIMEQGRLFGIEKFVGIGTVCSYPKFTPVPFKEANLWNGYPEETNAAYGLAKKMMLVQSQAYRQQYGFNSINPLLANLYGPCDNFDPNFSHSIPALIKKCVDAVDSGSQQIVVWGRGESTRDFFYVEDAAEGIILATEKYNKSDPFNLGTGVETSINHLIELIRELVGFNGEVVRDYTKPEGQPRRCLDTNKAKNEIGFEAKTSLKEGLKRTIDWYRNNILA